MNNQSLEIVLSGSEFDDEKNLYLMIEALNNLNRVVEKSYLTINNKKRMSEKDREVFQLKAREFKDGSLVIGLGMYVSALTQSSMFNTLTLSPTDIWVLVKDGYRFLKHVLKAHSEGRPIEMKGDNNMLVVVTGDNNKVEFHPEVIPYLNTSEQNFERLSKLVDPEKGVNGFSLSSEEQTDKITFSEEEKTLFESKTRIENEIIKIKAKIFDLNANDCTGELEVIDSDDVDVREGSFCKFDFVDKEKDHEFLSEIFLREIQLFALKETTFNPVTLEKEIKKLSIVNIE